MKATHLIRLRCGCEIETSAGVVKVASAPGGTCPCPNGYGQQPLKYSRPLKLKADPRLDGRPGEKRLTPREEAQALVGEVFALRAQKAEAEKQYADLKALIERLDVGEQALLKKLADEHGLVTYEDLDR